MVTHDTLTRRRFRWAVCQLDRLRRCFPASIRQALGELPKTLDETYERILLEIDEKKRVYAIRLFQCLAFSRRPLRVKELAEVLAIQFDTAIPELNTLFRPGDADEAVLSACSTLVATIGLDYGHNDAYEYNAYYPYNSRVVQFSHYSVKEFLTSERLAKSHKGDISQFHISPEPAHTILAQSCISTLLQPDIHIEDIKVSYPLAKYAARNWFHHARCDGVASRTQDGMERLFDPDKEHLAMWISIYYRDKFGHETPSPLYHAAHCGIESLVEYLVITRRQDPNQSRGRLGTPLHVAIVSGHIGIVQLLLSHGADVNALDERGDSPLHTAVVFRNPESTVLELEGGADAKTRSLYVLTLFPEAVGSRDLDVAQLLISHGADISALDCDRYTPLFKAVIFENFDFVELLLKAGADMNIRDIYYSTPLLRAVLDRNFEIAQSLISHGADVNALDCDRYSPLFKAVIFENFDFVELLLKAGADANIRNFCDSTPLHEAAEHGYLDIVQLLITHGADINALDCNESSPLHKAARFQKHQVVELLLKGGADVNVRNDQNLTPLYEAVECGSLDGVESLLTLGRQDVDVNTRGRCLRTLSHLASLRGSLDMSRLLIEHGADLNAQDNEGRTPFSVALASGHRKLALFLSNDRVSEHDV